MKIHFILSVLILFMIGCTETTLQNKTDDWANAKWIAYKQLEDSLKIKPGVHSLGNGEDVLGTRGTTRSIVPFFRKNFSLKTEVESAIIDISGLGHYELYINGAKVGDRFLSPGWTNYDKRELYNTYDITNFIKGKYNAIGVIVGNGFYNINRERYRKLVVAYGYPKLIFKIRIKYTDGTIEHIISDDTCKTAPSPITFSSIFGGEDYDARLEQPGWSEFGFDDAKWEGAITLNDSREKLFLEMDYPLKEMQILKPKQILKLDSGRLLYDFKQNCSGIVSIKVKGNKGAKVIIRPDELIDETQNITQQSGGGPYKFSYTLKGEGIEEWKPKFTYYGFRYADVEIIEPKNTKVKTEIVALNLLHTRNSSPTVGSFKCSDTTFNKIFKLIDWGIRSNMASLATDCPHREKLGWLEQTYLIGPSMRYNYNIQKLYTKIVDDIIDSQLDNGLIPDIAPEYVVFDGGFRDSPEWGSASIIIPWQLYKWYGDKELLKKAYPMMIRYVNYLHGKLDNNLLRHGLGDWYDIGPENPGMAQLTPKTLTASAIYYYDLSIVIEVAKMLNKKTEVKKYEHWANTLKEAFQAEFYDPNTGICSTGSQTSYAMSLYTRILPEKHKEKILNNLINTIKDNDYKLTSGDIGYHFLVRTLSENGRSDILYEMNNKSDRPGYGYQIKKGATSLTESWQALPTVSNNHMMLGHLMEWFYSGLGGIYQEDNSIAYQSFVIAPQPVRTITWVQCSFMSPKGLIASNWKYFNNTFNLKVKIPDDALAKIILPDNFKKSSIEIIDSESQKIISPKIDNGTFRLSKGNYTIIAEQ
ncbi:MAG: family 78 glycoside hydrolase catalytic domain [Flavobacteriaceae bacterium]